MGEEKEVGSGVLHVELHGCPMPGGIILKCRDRVT